MKPDELKLKNQKKLLHTPSERPAKLTLKVSNKTKLRTKITLVLPLIPDETYFGLGTSGQHMISPGVIVNDTLS